MSWRHVRNRPNVCVKVLPIVTHGSGKCDGLRTAPVQHIVQHIDGMEPYSFKTSLVSPCPHVQSLPKLQQSSVIMLLIMMQAGRSIECLRATASSALIFLLHLQSLLMPTLVPSTFCWALRQNKQTSAGVCMYLPVFLLQTTREMHAGS